MRAEGMTIVPLPVLEPTNGKIIRARAQNMRRTSPVEENTSDNVDPDERQGRLLGILEIVEERRRQNQKNKNKKTAAYEKMKNVKQDFTKGRVLNKAA